MDTSSGVDLNDYKIEKGFVQRIAMHLGVFHGNTRAALVAYGANASVAFSFGGYSSNSEFLRLVNDAPSIGGERRVDRALDTAAAMLLGSRSTMPKAVILFMAGKQSSVVDSIPIKDAARPLHQLGAWIYIMAIGQTDFNELQEVTIRPSDIFFARSFSGLYGYIAPVATYVANTSGKRRTELNIQIIKQTTNTRGTGIHLVPCRCSLFQALGQCSALRKARGTLTTVDMIQLLKKKKKL